MARTALYAPAHRVMGRTPPGVSGNQPATIGPSFDAIFAGVQDARLVWNSAASATSPEVIGWPDLGAFPVLDVIPAALGVVSISASAVPTAGVPLVLVTSTGAGITVSSSATLMMPSLVTIPSGSLFIDGVTAYQKFGQQNQQTWAYDRTTMLARAVAIHSAGTDTGAVFHVVGWDAYGYPLHEDITGGDTATVNGKKAFKAIASITPTGTLSGSAVSVGVSDVMGIPMYADVVTATWGFWNNLILTGTGTFVAGVTTSPATATTGDVRGTFVPGSSSAGGTKRLQLWMHPSMTTMIASGINVGMFGVAQF